MLNALRFGSLSHTCVKVQSTRDGATKLATKASLVYVAASSVNARVLLLIVWWWSCLCDTHENDAYPLRSAQ
jgi:hypothetical protein